MLRMKAMTERVTDNLVSHHPLVPRRSQPEQTVITTSGFIHSLHAQRLAPPHAGGKAAALGDLTAGDEAPSNAKAPDQWSGAFVRARIRS
ncbi:hypothetical protein GCM10022235_04580 [Kribbella ginsengisoli]|uniref:Uncharacterized protein n=1 Tax=Kribbella ginsengisoli TaxID=363865 RepID=A0ABP6VWA9_9ACTN